MFYKIFQKESKRRGIVKKEISKSILTILMHQKGFLYMDACRMWENKGTFEKQVVTLSILCG